MSQMYLIVLMSVPGSGPQAGWLHAESKDEKKQILVKSMVRAAGEYE